MNDIYHNIFELLSNYLPNDWEKVVFMANYGEGSYSMSFYVKKEGNYIDYHDLGHDRMTLMNLFMSIDKIIKPVREELTGKDLWYTLTMVIGSDGSFKADYDYEDVNDHFIDYKRDWTTKYLI